MKTHLVKIALFFGLQFAILGALQWKCGKPLDHPPAGAAGAYTLDQRVESYLREQLFPIWVNNRQVFESIAKAPEGNPILQEMVSSYVAGPDNYLAALVDKNARLQSIEGRRLIFVGGSGFAFGFDSPLVKERYGLEPVNLGLHAAVGTTFMLNHAMAHARKGDVFVLCFEHPCLLRNMETPDRKESIIKMSPAFEDYYDDKFSLKPKTEDPSGLDKLFIKRFFESKHYADKEALADAAKQVRHYKEVLIGTDVQDEEALENFNADFDRHRDRLVSSFIDLGLPLYRRTSFNEFGDFIAHRFYPMDVKGDAQQWASEISEALAPHQKQHLVFRINQINKFASVCQERGAMVLFGYPPLMERPQSAKFAQEYAAIVEANLTIPILFPVQATIFDDDFFFDTENHLTWEGTCRRMEMFVTALDEHLQPIIEESVTRQIAKRDQFVRGQGIIAAAPDQKSVN